MPPAIVTPPASQTVFTGANVTFTVSASGTPPLSYQWQKDTVNIAGANVSSLTLSSVTATDAGSYRVVVTNTAGSVTSAAATLIVNPAPTPPIITSQPVSQSVNAGANVSFTVAASGTAPLSYQWRKNAVAIPGATGTALNLTAVTTANAGSYNVVVTNAAGSVTSDTATLVVTQTTVIVSITSPTNGATFDAPANLSLAASATPAASITRVDFFEGTTLLGSLSAAPYTFNVMNLGQGSYTYTAQAVSASGTTVSSPVSILVTGPPPSTGPAVVTVTAS
ncbi:MAG: immunoglobulin domain-containing protein, partial [Verrucomicrobia bacterium]|nr:immunoglobulin domain-containing protein [Verrucomicrobiota bacterium]